MVLFWIIRLCRWMDPAPPYYPFLYLGTAPSVNVIPAGTRISNWESWRNVQRSPGYFLYPSLHHSLNSEYVNTKEEDVTVLTTSRFSTQAAENPPLRSENEPELPRYYIRMGRKPSAAWSAISDQAERRKAQNRLSQRKRRAYQLSTSWLTQNKEGTVLIVQ
jgi:hypothetical protein